MGRAPWLTGDKGEIAMTRIRLAAMVAVASVCACGAAPAKGPGDDASIFYMTSIAAPAMRDACEKINPGHAAKFDELFPVWEKRNAKTIAAGREFMRESGQTDAQLDASVREMVQKFFNEDTPENQKAGCNEMLSDLGG